MYVFMLACMLVWEKKHVMGVLGEEDYILLGAQPFKGLCHLCFGVLDYCQWYSILTLDFCWAWGNAHFVKMTLHLTFPHPLSLMLD